MSGVLYKTPDGKERCARADLTIVCEGMYSNLRSKLTQPKIAQPSLWKTFIPRFMRRDPSNLLPKDHKHVGFWSRFLANPASSVIILGMLTGNAAIHIIRIKKDTKLNSRKADQKIELLREVIRRVQNGENVDVERLLGTGDPKMEEEWAVCGKK